MDWLNIHTVPRLAKDYDDFRRIYDDLIMITLCPEIKTRHLGQLGRICRFCRRPYPSARFKKEAHIIPQFLGNKYLVSDDECDECNEMFGRFENDFKNYLGIIPTLTQTVGKSNTFPKYRSPKGEIIASKSTRLAIEGDFIEVFKENTTSNALDFDFEKGEVKGMHTKYPYIPYNVYKALLKIGLSCLQIQYFIDYRTAVEVLYSELLIPKPLTYVHVTTFPMDLMKFRAPHVYIFSKRKHSNKCLSHLVMLYYQNQIFQYFLPYNVHDRDIYTVQKAMFQFGPPFFTSPVTDQLQFNTQLLDLSSNHRRINEIQEFSFNVNYDKERPFFSFNPKTGDYVEYEHHYPKNIVGFVTVPKGTVLTKEDFKTKI
jgi:hypothetical protein